MFGEDAGGVGVVRAWSKLCIHSARNAELPTMTYASASRVPRATAASVSRDADEVREIEAIEHDDPTFILERPSVAALGPRIPPMHSTVVVSGQHDDGDTDDGNTVVRDTAISPRKASVTKEGPSVSRPTALSAEAAILATLGRNSSLGRPSLLAGPPLSLLDDERESVASNAAVVAPPIPPKPPLAEPRQPSFGGNGTEAAPDPWRLHSQVQVAPKAPPSATLGAPSMGAHVVRPVDDRRAITKPSALRRRAAGRPAMAWVLLLLTSGVAGGMVATLAVQRHVRSASIAEHGKARAEHAAPLVAPALERLMEIPSAAEAPLVPAAPLPVPPSLTALDDNEGVASAAAGSASTFKPSAPVARDVRGVRGARDVRDVSTRPAEPKAPSNPEPAPERKPAKRAAKADPPNAETRRALEALQKAQLESATSFGDE
jgi:hypothetical protein